MTLPNLIIAGVPRAGTTSLHRWLSAHPDAAGSTPKETAFFIDPDSHQFDPAANAATSPLDRYERFFASAGNRSRVVFEATPAYLYSRTALERLPDLASQPQFLFVLREPGSQIHSMFRYFQHNWQMLPAAMTFDDYISLARIRSERLAHNPLLRHALDHARYVDYLLQWRSRCDPNRIHVCLYDELRRSPSDFVRGVCKPLGLDSGFYDTYAFPRENDSYVPRSRFVHAFNVRIRDRLPKGALYRFARSAYRMLNSRTEDRVSPGDDPQQLVAELSAEFAEANALLADAFSLDLSTWNRPGMPPTAAAEDPE